MDRGRCAGKYFLIRGLLCVLIVLSVGPLACQRRQARAGTPPCVPDEKLSARARCEPGSNSHECTCGPADWGAPCSKHVDCKCGLECLDSVCASRGPRCGDVVYD
jgi:hypothetical protein